MARLRVSLDAALIGCLALAAGCSSRGAHPELAAHPPYSGAASAGDLMAERDRAALAALAQERSAQGRGGYRIGPDDLLDIRITKLLSAKQAGTTVPGKGAVGAMDTAGAVRE